MRSADRQSRKQSAELLLGCFACNDQNLLIASTRCSVWPVSSANICCRKCVSAWMRAIGHNDELITLVYTKMLLKFLPELAPLSSPKHPHWKFSLFIFSRSNSLKQESSNPAQQPPPPPFCQMRSLVNTSSTNLRTIISIAGMKEWQGSWWKAGRAFASSPLPRCPLMSGFLRMFE